MQLKHVLFFLVFISHFSLAFATEKAPVIFAHGFWINSEVYEYLLPLKKIFKKNGYRLLVARTPIGGSLEERAEVLYSEIERLVPSGRFHLVGHSMGGLDSRLVISKYNLGERCLSLTTLATPHRGSAVADYVVDHFGETLAMDILDKLFHSDMKAIRQLSIKHMTTSFNQKIKDDHRVKYFSMSFYIPAPITRSSVIPWLWVTHGIQSKAGFLENDGVVSVSSSIWGKSLGVFPGDHYSETAPFPMQGKLMFEDVFLKVAENLDREF